jgi:hypothetical protein
MLENPKVNIKIKLAALWTAVTFCYLYGDYFDLYTPGKVESLISGDGVLDSPMSLFIASLVMAFPPLMVAVSVFLKPKLNRLLNIIVGIIFTLMMVLIAVTSLTPWFTFYVFLAILEAILTSIIVWKAWTWPKKIADSN